MSRLLHTNSDVANFLKKGKVQQSASFFRVKKNKKNNKKIGICIFLECEHKLAEINHL